MSNRRFSSIPVCPACSCPNRSLLGNLPGHVYQFGRAIIPFPETGIPLYRCTQCGLAYKGNLPSKRFLADIIEREARHYWLNGRAFETIAPELSNLLGAHYDLIDVGAWSGGLLAACAAAGGRRSAIDIVQHPDLAGVLRGEFVRGFIEDQDLAMGDKPYDVVTMFDIMEHLYEPNAAFENVCRLLRPGGVVVIETGNSGAFSGPGDDLASWWYIRLLDHHLVWNSRSIHALAGRHGLVVERVVRVRHKAHRGDCTARAWRLLTAGMCWNGHRVWKSKLALFRLQRKTRANNGFDHLRVVLRRPRTPLPS